MEDISPSPVESGFLTGPNSGRPTPSTTQGTLYTSDEQLNDDYEIQKKLPRNRLHSSSVNNLDEVRLSDRQQSSFSQNSSSPNISESFRRRNEPISSEINKAETEREAPQEQQLLLQNPAETADNAEKKSVCCKSVKVWLCIIVCCCVSVILAVLLGRLFSRCAVKDLSSCGPPCNESWIWVGGRCYFFSDDSNTWNDSREFCTTHGSTLAMLIDQNITKTIERYRGKWNYWIGLSIDHNGQWMWINGSPFNGSVENGNDNHLRCTYLNSRLGALDCSTRRQWICVKDSI